MNSLILFTLACLAGLSLAEYNCHKKWFDQESFVCTCNDAKNCPDLKVSKVPQDGMIYSFQSDQQENRFLQEKFKPEDLYKEGNGVKLYVKKDQLRQQIIGFGGAFTDGAGLSLRALPEDLARSVMRDYFSTEGIEYNMGRVPIGGENGALWPYYTYQDDVEDLTFSHFALKQEDFDNKIPYLKMANEMAGGNMSYFCTVWSPPPWMKYQKRIAGTGNLIGDPGGPYYKGLATYIIKFMEEYGKHGVKFWGMSTENEPSAGYKPGYEFYNLGLSPEQIKEWVKLDLGPALQAAGYTKDNFKVMIIDDNIIYVELFAHKILNDAEAKKHISGIAYHWYDNFEFGYENLDKVHSKFPDVFILQTEACDGFDTGIQLGSWYRGERYAQDIIENLNHWAAGWVDWNLALGGIEGDYKKSALDASIVVDPKTKEYHKQPSYYAIGHFSKFLKPGSTGLQFYVGNPNPNVFHTVFRNTQGQTVIVILNRDHQPVDVTIYDVAKSPINVNMREHSIRTIVVNN